MEITKVIESLTPVNATIITSAFFFSILYIIKIWPFGPIIANYIKSHNKKNIKNINAFLSLLAVRVGCFIHNIIQIPFAFYLLNNEIINNDHFMGTTHTSKIFTSISVGYFLTDLYTCTMNYEHEGFAYLIHAFLCTSVYLFALLYNSFHYYAAAFILWELSTPFVHIRWILFKFGYDDTLLYIVNGMLLIFSFFGCRIVFGNYVSYDLWVRSEEAMSDPDNVYTPLLFWTMRVINAFLNFLNIFWFYQILSKAYNILSNGKRNSIKTL